MSLMELFSSSNTGNTNKKTGVTALGHVTHGGNTGNTSNIENAVFKTQYDKVEWMELPEFISGALIVTCYTPAGNPVEVEASCAEHAEFLLRMNPNRT